MKSTTRVERTEEKNSSKQSPGSHKTETKTQSRFPAAKKRTSPEASKVSKHAVKHTLIYTHAPHPPTLQQGIGKRKMRDVQKEM
jgi:hypothetical protein